MRSPVLKVDQQTQEANQVQEEDAYRCLNFIQTILKYKKPDYLLDSPAFRFPKDRTQYHKLNR